MATPNFRAMPSELVDLAPGRPRCETSSTGQPVWRITCDQDESGMEAALEAETPSNEELRARAKKQRPPQAWFDAHDDPFDAEVEA